MKPSLRRSVARRLARQLKRIAPPARSHWAEAMRREQEAIDDAGEALRFAAGCLWACSMERLRSLDLVLCLARGAMIVGTGTLALFGFLTAARLGPIHSQGALIVAVISAAFASASLLLARRGPTAPWAIAAVMLVLSSVAFLALPLQAQYAKLYRALALEGVVLWSMLLAAGFSLEWASRSDWLRDRTRERGW
jgi:hypothetical protein